MKTTLTLILILLSTHLAIAQVGVDSIVPVLDITTVPIVEPAPIWVRYYDTAGRELAEPAQGMTLELSLWADGYRRRWIFLF